MSESMLTIISPNGAYTHEVITKLSLERAQELVGGMVQVVPAFSKFSVDGELKAVPCAVLCDEEGKLKGYPVNNRATLEWFKAFGSSHDDMLVGSVVVITGPARKSWG